jgi:very-short-patch-repair endonuclease/predicted transcriptional regulator of viral defense system
MRPKPHSEAGAADAREVGNALGAQKAVARLARKQHGIVTRTQLLSLGIGAQAIKRRVRAGRLRVVYRGTYLVGPMMQALSREMAAVLACGEGAVLSHQSAAALSKLLPYPAQSPVHVTVPRALAQRAGMCIHRVKELPPSEVMRRHGIAVTTPARTIIDIAAEVTAGELEQAVATAVRNHRTTRPNLDSLLARYPRRPGTRALRTLLERGGRPAFTRSRPERRLLDLIRKARLPAPEANLKTERYELDLYWPEYRLAVEVDTLWTHSSAESFEADRRRDAELAADGIQVMRITDVGIADEPERQIALISQALALRRAAA